MSENLNRAGIHAVLGAGSLILNDYALDITPIERGYRLTVTRGSETQTMDVLDGVGIVGIEKTGSTGDVDSYRISFTDGSTFDYTVETNAATYASAEAARVEAENSRVSAEAARVSAEAGRVNAEDARVAGEAARESAEAARASAESAREQAEDGRKNAEAARVAAEQSRASAESVRVAAENARVTAETARANAENERAGAETLRAAEETDRANAESGRVSAEQGRVSAESERVAAEEARATEFAGFSGEIAQLKGDIGDLCELTKQHIEDNPIGDSEYYKTIKPLEAWNKYELKITVSVTGKYTFSAGTKASSSSMVDVIKDSVELNANEEYSFKYTPTGEYTYIRCADDNNESTQWSLSVYKMVSVASVDEHLSSVDEHLSSVEAHLSSVEENEIKELKNDIDRLDILDLKIVRDTLGVDKIYEGEIVYDYTGGTYRYKDVTISEEITGLVSVVVDELYLPSVSPGIRVYNADKTTMFSPNITETGVRVFDLNGYTGLILQLQVNESIECETGTYFAKVTVYSGDITKQVQGFPDYLIGKDISLTPTTGKNILNVDDMENGNFSSNGALIDSTSYSRTRNIIPVIEGETYTLQSGTDIPAKIKMRWVFAYNYDEAIVDSNQFVETYTVPTGQGIVGIKVAIDNKYANESAGTMLSKGTEISQYEPYRTIKYLDYGVKIKNAIDYDIIDDMEKDLKRSHYDFRYMDAVCSEYSCTSPFIASPGHQSVNAVYDMYDELMNKYPDYITKTLIGTIDGYGYEVYRYDFTPPVPISSTESDVCKILYCTGTHGEYPNIWVGIRFLKDLCDNWRSDKMLQCIRFGCHITAIPLVNPYGFINNSRKNENGIDINRNFTTDWIFKTDDVDSVEYQGLAPASEKSTQIIEDLCAGERFDFGIDHHVYGSFSGSGMLGYFVNCLKKPENVSFGNMYGLWANQKCMAENTLISDFSTSYFKTFTKKYSFDGYLYGAFENGILWESMTEWGNAEMEAVVESQKFNVECLAALIYSAMKHYRRY